MAVAASSLPFAIFVSRSSSPDAPTYAAIIRALLATVSGASGLLACASLTILKS